MENKITQYKPKYFAEYFNGSKLVKLELPVQDDRSMNALFEETVIQNNALRLDWQILSFPKWTRFRRHDILSDVEYILVSLPEIEDQLRDLKKSIIADRLMVSADTLWNRYQKLILKRSDPSKRETGLTVDEIINRLKELNW